VPRLSLPTAAAAAAAADCDDDDGKYMLHVHFYSANVCYSYQFTLFLPVLFSSK